ncbi:MerR family transcriptional regulator [Paenibacillus agaridevorans]|uniref:MerR family transcriptional regulator n=1 Tax=Paenibacillus agaridevorans TaxID=171404 RepID=A0A2R5EV68_9BACL|nr:MerR family transcriptional regulator [Paenibacillus agaridevorans]GBG10596.1 MerR family transcriptional regulator [Paenibacillus agaridevorans]
MKISELSKRTGASTRSIRHYENKKILSAVRLENDYREFDESAVERIRRIQFYLGLGLTIEQIQDLSKCDESGPQEYEVCDDVLEVYQEKEDQINKQIRAMEVVKNRLDEQIVKMTKRRKLKKTSK